MAAQALSKPKFMEVIRRWDWLLVVLVAPALILPEKPKALALLMVPCVLVVQWLAWREVLPVTPLNPAILLIAVMVGVSTLVTPDITISLGSIAGVLFGMLVFFCVARHGRTKKGWKGALIIFFLAGLGLAALGLAGTNWSTTKNLGLSTLTDNLPIRLAGLPGIDAGINPNILAGTLLWVIPVIVLTGLALMGEPSWFSKRTIHRGVRFWEILGWIILLSITFLLTMGLLVLSQSRISYLAIALTGLVLLIMIPRGRARWWMVGLLSLDAIVGVLLIQQTGVKTLVNQFIDNTSSNGSNYLLDSLSMREEIWSRAMWAIQDVPLTGLGMNIFPEAAHMLYPSFQFSAGYSMEHAHNELLQSAIELGLPGMVGMIALYVGALAMLAPAISSSGTVRLLGLGLLGGLLAHLIYGQSNSIVLAAKPGFLFWWMLGMIFGLYYQNRAANEKKAWKESTQAG